MKPITHFKNLLWATLVITLIPTTTVLASPNIKTQNLNWAKTPNQLNPQMNWETNQLNLPIIQKTHGKNHNIVYYYMPMPNIIHGEIKTAVNHWNQLHVLKLKRTHNQKLAGFTITFNDDPIENRNAAGVTIYQNTSDLIFNQAYFKKVHIYIEPVVAIYQNPNDGIAVIEHEIGHALGFGHDEHISIDPNNPKLYAETVMSKGNIHYPHHTQVAKIPLGAREQNALKKQYHLN